TDDTKIEAMKHWPIPSNLKQLRGFLGLTRYYRRFIKGYALIFETDASGEGIGVVLQQSGHPIAYCSKTLAPRHHSLSTYEKELLAVIQSLHKWRGYFLDRHFIIKTNHFSLKYLLEQRITTPTQMKWLPKLIGFDYEIVYKKGIKNGAADALSRVDTCSQLLSMVLTSRSKPDLSAYPGLLQPLPIPILLWSEISMDFVEGLSNSGGKTVIMVVVDRLSKYSHFMALSHPFTVSLHFYTAYHPQSDGKTEMVNRCLECYLRYMTGEKPKEWAKWLSLAEYCTTSLPQYDPSESFSCVPVKDKNYWKKEVLIWSSWKSIKVSLKVKMVEQLLLKVGCGLVKACMELHTRGLVSNSAIRRKVRNGRNTRFWKDMWCGDGTLEATYHSGSLTMKKLTRFDRFDKVLM
nr:reverse transcriptase [Tanacetum cinerariifolium]